MTATAPATGPVTANPGADLPRLLGYAPDLASHVARYGALPSSYEGVLGALEEANLRGRGGAGFPTARKIAAVAVAAQTAPGACAVVVANGTEGEPLSLKDKALLTVSPHLVLDGLALAARLVEATRQVICIERGNHTVEAAVRGALLERGGPSVEVVTAPRRYLSGQETALVSHINGGTGKPGLERPFVRGVGGLPTLVDNVETLAHLALIARYGASWYREVGTPEDPGSSLVTVTGCVARPGVYEVANGSRFDDLLARAGVGEAGATRPRAVLVGGYYGRWARANVVSRLALGPAALARAGLSFGCGVIAVLDDNTCAVAETARVAAWFAANSAGQCGACTWGLRDLAHTTARLSTASAGAGELGQLHRWANMIEGRGACRLPDGAIAFLRSALEVFADEIDEHIAGRCRRSDEEVLCTPAPEAWE